MLHIFKASDTAIARGLVTSFLNIRIFRNGLEPMAIAAAAIAPSFQVKFLPRKLEELIETFAPVDREQLRARAEEVKTEWNMEKRESRTIGP